MQQKYTSVSDMLFRYLSYCIIVLLSLMFVPGHSFCKVVDRVVASVDDLAITESELNEQYHEMVKINKDIKRLQTLNTMINRKLLLKDAKKYRMEGKEDDIINQYIDLKIRALVRIQDKEVRNYFHDHGDEFRGHQVEEVYKDIVQYLTELKVNERLRLRIEKLRSETSIHILIDNSD